MAIYLDTSVLPRPPAPLHTTTLTVLSALANEHDTAVVLPQLVVEESVSARRRAIEEAIRDVKKATKALSGFAPYDLGVLPDPHDYADSWRVALTTEFQVAAQDEAVATEALYRETHRLAPAREGRGARDAAIWLTVRDHHANTGEAGFFVSENVADFADPNSPENLHPDLVDEIALGGAPLLFCRSVTHLLSEIAEETDVALEAADLSGSASVVSAVASAFQEPLVLTTLHAQPADAVGTPYVASQIDAETISLFDSRSFSVAGSPIYVTNSRWRFAFTMGSLRRHSGGGLAETLTPVSGDANVQLLLRLSADGAVESADVVGNGVGRIATHTET